ncbi:unnamed protein product [Spirodela intermedia]|uniref:Uncharacterized protein n=2 Tax=Spirodela intermedia TaxID=51605 RepID=A0A7I8KEL8_SPIIN|nr:unnamed protein product [Spirodela intermedia]CAA6659223.1 unnamed protein product [Spirodela intermedia]CAA6675856.1 unnamed protein product [Spirodela intermedia]CAA7395538.1 unnamed protein product [Spirodela intermedia]
MQRIRWHYSH